MRDLNESVYAPPPIRVTFSEDAPGSGIRLADPWWPGRLRLTGDVLVLATHGLTRGLTVDPHDPMTWEPRTVRFNLTNATAVYREIDPPDYLLWQRDIWEFDCVSCSRDLEP